MRDKKEYPEHRTVWERVGWWMLGLGVAAGAVVASGMYITSDGLLCHLHAVSREALRREVPGDRAGGARF